jgi:hypothetical protein
MYLASNWIIFIGGCFFVHVASFFNKQPWQSSATLALLSWELPSQTLFHRTWLVENIRMIKFGKIEFLLYFLYSAFSPIFYDFLHKCYHISAVGKDISKILTVINSWDVKLEVRMHCQKCLQIKTHFM